MSSAELRAHPRRVGVLGLGRMGRPIAEALAAAGFAVTGFDIDTAKTAGLAASGIAVADGASALAETSDLLITVLPGPAEIADAMGGRPGGKAGVPDVRPGGAPGLLHSMPPASCWLDLSSGDPELMVRLSAVAAELGVGSVEAPMGGTPDTARAASLSFFVSGTAGAVAAALPVLEALSEPGGIHLLGESPGAGQTAKLLANLLWFGQSIAVTEVMLLGSRRGIDQRALRAALATSAGGSVFIDRHLDALLTGDYLETFGIDRVVEELETASRLAAAAETPFELSDLVTSIHRRALQRFGAVNGELLAARLLEEQAGITLADEA